MGTRNKTMVIKDKQVLINQYGQWDGYPTRAAAVIIDFIQNNGINKINEFIPKLEQVNIKNNGVRFAEMTLSFDKDFEDIQKFIYYNENGEYGKKFIDRDTHAEVYFSSLDIEQQIDILVSEFGYERSALYIMLTRDTGYKVLDAMSYFSEKFPDKKIPVIIDEYDGFDIEGKNIIDLDNNIFITKYHDKIYTYSFDKLPTMNGLEEMEMLDQDKKLNKIFETLTENKWSHISEFENREVAITFYKADEDKRFAFYLIQYPKSNIPCSKQFLEQVEEKNYYQISDILSKDRILVDGNEL